MKSGAKESRTKGIFALSKWCPASPSISILGGLTLTGINNIRIGFGGGQVIDNLIPGETAADVNGIPEPTAAVLAFLGLAPFLRRRRRAS